MNNGLERILAVEKLSTEEVPVIDTSTAADCCRTSFDDGYALAMAEIHDYVMTYPTYSELGEIISTLF